MDVKTELPDVTVVVPVLVVFWCGGGMMVVLWLGNGGGRMVVVGCGGLV